MARQIVAHFLRRTKADAVGRTWAAMGTCSPIVLDGVAALAAVHDVEQRVREMNELDELEGGAHA